MQYVREVAGSDTWQEAKRVAKFSAPRNQTWFDPHAATLPFLTTPSARDESIGNPICFYDFHPLNESERGVRRTEED